MGPKKQVAAKPGNYCKSRRNLGHLPKVNVPLDPEDWCYDTRGKVSDKQRKRRDPLGVEQNARRIRQRNVRHSRAGYTELDPSPVGEALTAADDICVK